MRTVLIQLRFEKPVNQQCGVAGNEMTNDMAAFADIGRTSAEIGFQDTEAILNLVSACTDIKDF